MRTDGFEMRELSEIEFFQIAGGCDAGTGCPCKGSSAYPSDDGTLLRTWVRRLPSG
jgi:hypothetical protein